MANKRKDNKGRNLQTGEYFDGKNNRYMFRKMVDGNRMTITASDLVELRRKKNELLCQIDKGCRFNNKGARMTLNEYFEFWLEVYAKSSRKATTITNYKSYYNTYIRNTIGKKRITKITKTDCQQIINEMIQKGKKHSTMTNLKSCLNCVFECAVDEDIILKNPAQNLQFPQTETKIITAVDAHQLSIFMDYVKNSAKYSYSYPAFVVLFNLGIRIGEMAALTWEDIDFKKEEITINKTVNRYRKADYGFTMGVASPKSKTSNRKVIMNHLVKSVLLEHKLRSGQQSETLPFLDDYGHVRKHVTGFVFHNTAHHVWNEPSFNRLIKRIVEKLNSDAEKNGTERIEIFTPHASRHTFTSFAYSAGLDAKMVSDTLGHASVSVTLNTYAHLTEEKKREQSIIAQAIRIS
ncbi:site-specific integrase [Sellimonas sp.]|uniref:site-specific integrase n=1 Tax=Sellimonas sp. TaxID=2021466 RepID=UPI000B39A4D5|nr:site-specific integrase [Sellimonas sp.]OUP00574.1 hypothetical protein B5F37_10450 [Drancourtella sp. An210]OUP65810.1 hypothetical protein B5F13_04975 [Drancourtella sp. An177]